MQIWQRRSQDFCLGGGHPADVTRYISPEADQIQWGGEGVVAEFFYISDSNNVTTSIHSHAPLARPLKYGRRILSSK